MTHKYKKNKPLIDPEDVLAGKISLSPLELIRLIHRVNPTGDDLGPEDERARYQLKARLQSLLIKLHSEGLRIEQADPEQPHLIGLRLRHFADDACHAFIQELDEDARSWVQRQIDKGQFVNALNSAPEMSASIRTYLKGQPETADTASSEELLASGRKAFDEYDYEQCEFYYQQAWERSPGHVQAALSLLDLWVNYLASYEKALAFAESFSHLVKKNKDMRMRLGLACIHLQRVAEALRWIDSLLEPQAAEIYFLAVKHFLSQKDDKRAAKTLTLLKSCQATEFAPRIAQLEKDVRAAHAKTLAPLEAEMMQAWQAGDFAKASGLAAELLHLLPENKVAHTILSEVNKGEQIRKIKQLLQSAEEAKSRHDPVSEADLLSRAMAAGENSAAAKQRLAEAQREVRCLQEKEQNEKVMDLLVHGGLTPALLSYLELEPSQRKQIRGRLGDPRLLWIEQALAAEPALKSEKIVKAAIVLGEAKEAWAKGDDPQQIIDQLQFHYRVLQAVPLTREIMQQAEGRLKNQERTINAGLLEKAQNALADHNLRLVRELLEQIKVKRLEADDRTRYEAINGALNKLEERQLLRQKFKECLTRGDHLTARNIAGQFAALSQGEESINWQEAFKEQAALLKKEWRLATVDIEELPACYGLLGINAWSEEQQSCLLPDGDRLLFAASHGPWVFLKTFCLAEQRFKKGHLLRLPKPIAYLKIAQLGNSLWIISEDAYLIALSLDPLDIISARDYSNFVGESWVCEGAWVFPRHRCLWLDKRDLKERSEEIIEIINIDQHRSMRQLKGTAHPVTINTGEEFRIAMADFNSRSVRIYNASGRLVDTYMLETSGIFTTAAVHPDGAELVFLPYDDTGAMSPLAEPENMGDFLLTLEVKPDMAKKYKPLKLPDTHGETHHLMFTSLDAGLVYTYFQNQAAENENYLLAAWKPSDQGLEMVYSAPAPGNLIYACDEFTKKIAVVQSSDRKIRAVLLDDQPPVFEDDPDEIAVMDFPSFAGTIWPCSSPTGNPQATALALAARLKDAGPKEYRRLVSDMKQAADPDELAALAQAVGMMFHFDEEKNLRAWMSEKYPDHYLVRLKLAEEAMKNSAWQRIIEIVTGVDFNEVDDGTGRHLCHLLGMAYFASGDVPMAVDAWKRGQHYELGKCDLTPYIEVAELSLLSPQQRKERKQENNIAKKLNLYEEIDLHLASREWTSALAMIETECPLQRGEVQVLARLAQAYLNVNYPTGGMRWFCKIMALAYYCSCYEDPYKANLLLPPFIQWSKGRLNDIFLQAEQWLEAVQSLGDQEV